MRLSGPTLDASDPLALAMFYQRLLGWTIVEQEQPSAGDAGKGWAMLRSPSGTQKLEVQWEPNYQRPTWPSSEGEQLMMMHLDFGVDNLRAGVDWAIAAGATIAANQPQDDVVVLLDPEGHPFCLFPDKSL